MPTMTITGKKCPTCGDPIAPAKDAAQYNRNLALHNRSKHGYKSPKFEAAKRYKAGKSRLADSANSASNSVHWTQRPENRAKLAKQQRLAWERRRSGLAPTTGPKRKYTKRSQQQQTSEVVACRLEVCPVCNSRFYVAKGTI